ncbi:uncharacterized protein LOC122242337 [Penaeus japonicus]|uniref:uncharacterized protein LOC122242337 n=1 Tax=Penaeus japonicus TaxID=27405 RepID=UPI001C712FB2|nr:uncharacterized protein LOC122242337 [Penaeus japonicus]
MVMTKVLLLVLGVIVTGSLGDGYDVDSVPAFDPIHPGTCLADGDHVRVGDSYTRRDCVKVECRHTHIGLRMFYTRCSQVVNDRKCGLVNNPKGQFPDCCFRPNC